MKRNSALDMFLKTRIAPYIAVLLLWFVFIWPYVAKGLVPIPSAHLVSFFPPWNARYAMPVKNGAMPDVVTQIIPWKMITVSQWQAGQMPLWNPYAFAGTPHAANYQSAVFSPVNLLFLVLPFIDAWSISVLLQPLLAGLFMALFLGRLGVGTFPRVLGAVSFMFSGFIVTWMAYGTLGYAALVVPLACWGALLYRDTGSRKGLLAISAAIGFSFLSGHFQISLYAAGASLLWIGYLFYGKPARLLRAFLAWIAGLLLAGIQLIQTVEAYLLSQRIGDLRITEIIPWSYVPTLLSPDYYGNPVTRNDWFGHYAEWAGYAGVVTMGLVLYGAIRSRIRERNFFIVLGLLSIVSAYRTPVQDAIRLLGIPVLSTSAASRIIFLASISFAVLGSFGLDSVMRDLMNRSIRWQFLVPIPALVAALWFVTYIAGFDAEALIIARRNLILPTMLALGSVLVLFFAWRFRRLLPVAISVLIVLSMFDHWRYAAKWMPFESREYVFPDDPMLSYLKDNAGVNRVFGGLGGEAGNAYRLQLIEGYDAMYMRRYAELINAVAGNDDVSPSRSVVMLDKHAVHRDRLLTLLGVRYIVHRQSDGRSPWAFPYWEYGDSMKQVYADGNYEIFEYQDAFPRAFLAGSYIRSTEDAGVLDMIRDTGIDLRETVILEEDPPIAPAGGGNAEIIRYVPGEVTVSYDAADPSMLVLTDSYHPGWKAWLADGQELDVLRADYQLLAVSVPAGTDSVTFRFRPQSLGYGLMATSLGALLVGCLYFYTRYENRNR